MLGNLLPYIATLFFNPIEKTIHKASLGMLASAAVFAWLTPILPRLLGPDSDMPMNSEEASWMVTMPEFGHLVSPLPAGFLADRFGRKTVMLSSAPLILMGWIIVIYFKTFLVFNIARFFQGFAVGMVFTVTPMYLGEIASPKFRGAVTSLFFGFWWFGYLFEYFLGPKLPYMQFTYVSASTSIIFFLLFLWQPESPYYYLMKDDLNKAHKALSWFKGTSEDEVINELESMRRCVEEDREKKMACNELIATPADRRALMILLLIGFLRQFCGIYPLSLYSTETLSTVGKYFFISADNVTLGMGVMMMVGSVGSSFTLDIFGRRLLLFLSCLMSAILLFCSGTFFFFTMKTNVDTSPYQWIPPVCLIIFAGVPVMGIFPVSVAYASELFTSNTRATASALFNVYTTILSILTFKFYLTISEAYGVFVNFYIFAAVSFLGATITFCVMPETKGKSFEQIRQKLQKLKPTT